MIFQPQVWKPLQMKAVDFRGFCLYLDNMVENKLITFLFHGKTDKSFQIAWVMVRHPHFPPSSIFKAPFSLECCIFWGGTSTERFLYLCVLTFYLLQAWDACICSSSGCNIVCAYMWNCVCACVWDVERLCVCVFHSRSLGPSATSDELGPNLFNLQKL